MQESASLLSTELEPEYTGSAEQLLSMAFDGRDVLVTVVADAEPQAPPESPFVLEPGEQSGPEWTFRLEPAPEVFEPGLYELAWIRGGYTYSVTAAYAAGGGVIIYPKPEGPK